MKKIIFLLLLSTACSTPKPEPQLTEQSGEAPAWLYSPYELCQEEAELCATGEGQSMNEADAQARTNLASVFEVQVKSEFSASSNSSQTFPWQGQVREEVQKSIQESVQQVLETVEIKKRYKVKNLSHSIAVLNRRKVLELLGSRLEKVDNEIDILFAKKQRTNLRRIVKLNLEREKLSEKYSIVAGHGIPPKVSYAQIVEFRESKPKQEPLVLRVGQAPDWMREKLTELLTEAGFKIVRSGAEKVLTLNVESIKEFLNVDGFEKHTFTLNITSTEQGQKTGSLSASETVTGRSQADALLKVKSYFTDYLEQHLSNLHLD
jgi:hypothetical protein